MEITLKIKKVTLLLRDGHTDRISIHLDTAPAFPLMGYGTSADLDAQQGHGLEWCRQNLGIEPEIIDARSPLIEGRHTQTRKDES